MIESSSKATLVIICDLVCCVALCPNQQSYNLLHSISIGVAHTFKVHVIWSALIILQLKLSDLFIKRLKSNLNQKQLFDRIYFGTENSLQTENRQSGKSGRARTDRSLYSRFKKPNRKYVETIEIKSKTWFIWSVLILPYSIKLRIIRKRLLCLCRWCVAHFGSNDTNTANWFLITSALETSQCCNQESPAPAFFSDNVTNWNGGNAAATERK